MLVLVNIKSFGVEDKIKILSYSLIFVIILSFTLSNPWEARQPSLQTNE